MVQLVVSLYVVNQMLQCPEEVRNWPVHLGLSQEELRVPEKELASRFLVLLTPLSLLSVSIFESPPVCGPETNDS